MIATHVPLQFWQVPFHAAGAVEPHESGKVASIAKPIIETVQMGVNYVTGQLTPSKLVKAGMLFGAVQAISSVPTADAGFALFHICWTTCAAATGGAFIPACVAACLAAVPAPTP